MADGNALFNELPTAIRKSLWKIFKQQRTVIKTDVIGDLTGDVIGNIVGDVIGELQGDVVGNVVATDDSIILDNGADQASSTLRIGHSEFLDDITMEYSFVLTGGNETAMVQTYDWTGTLTGNGSKTGIDTFLTSDIVNTGNWGGTFGHYYEMLHEGGTALFTNPVLAYSWVTGGTSNYAYGMEGWVECDGGNIGEGYGTSHYIAQYSGTFTTAYGTYTDIDGTIGTVYGLYVDMEDATGTLWGLYMLGETDNYLSGNLEIEGAGGITLSGVGDAYAINVSFSPTDGPAGGADFLISPTGTLSDDHAHTGVNIYLDSDITTNGNDYNLYGIDIDMNATGITGTATVVGINIDTDASTDYAIYADGAGANAYFAGNLTVEGGSVDIGIDDTQGGVLNLYGNATGSNLGGKVRVYVNEDDSGSIAYYDLLNEDTYFKLKGANDTTYFQAGHHNHLEFYVDLRIYQGELSVGTQDTTNGVVTITGDDDDIGGQIRLDFGALYDDEGKEFFGLKTVEDDFYMGPEDDPDSLWYSYGNNEWYFTEGLVKIGVQDNTRGQLRVFGEGEGDNGGLLELYLAADHDDEGKEYFSIKVFEDDLLIGPEATPDFIKVKSDQGGILKIEKSLDTGGERPFQIDTYVTADHTDSQSVNQHALWLQLYTEQDANGEDYYATGLTVRIQNGGVSNYDERGIYGIYIDTSGTVDYALYTEGTSVPSKFEGALELGIEDNTNGVLHIYGSNVVQGGVLNIYQSDDNDGTVDAFIIQAAQGVLYIGHSLDNDGLVYHPTDNDFNFTCAGGIEVSGGETFLSHGTLKVGDEDSTQGLVHIWCTSELGGVLRLEVSGDDDANITHWDVKSFADDLYLGNSADPDVVKITYEKDLYVTDGSIVLPASEYLNFGGTQGTGGYGIRDNAGTMEFKNSGGAWAAIT